MNGQALVETAIVMPVLLLLLLGLIGVAYLMLAVQRDQNGIETIAALAARDNGWQLAVADQDRRSGCNANPLMPAVTDLGRGRRQFTWSCHLRTGWMFDGLQITVTAFAVSGGGR